MFRFKEIIELWRSDNLLTQALNDSYAMLESTEEMFIESVKSLRESDTGEMGMDVYKKDQVVNKYQREVRSKVLKHLAITGGAHIIPGLILTSIVIDIERIGDYTKNIKDLAVAHPKRLECGSYEEDIRKIEQGVAGLFREALPALKDSDKVRAARLMKDNWWMIRRSDEIVEELIKEKDTSLSPRDAVSTAVYARFLKRIAAHLINMLTSVVNPFESIGFHGDDEV
jgi:phosphate transport system protein